MAQTEADLMKYLHDRVNLVMNSTHENLTVISNEAVGEVPDTLVRQILELRKLVDAAHHDFTETVQLLV